MKLRKTGPSGFTLIEVIIALVVIAVMAAMIAGYFGTGITRSAAPIARLKGAAQLNQVMQKITAAYEQYPHWRPNTPYPLNAVILPTTGWSTYNGIWNTYIVSTTGTSGTEEPDWQHLTGSPNDGSVTWTLNGVAPTLTNLQTNIGATGGGEDRDYSKTTPPWDFGNYRVRENRFIKFDASSTEENINSITSDLEYGKFLKVTIRYHSQLNPFNNEEDHTEISTLFVRR